VWYSIFTALKTNYNPTHCYTFVRSIHFSMSNHLVVSTEKSTFNLKNELLAGFTVAMTMIPESLSFAILAGLSPLTGLYAAFLMGLVTAILGGRPGMVSGGAGATIIVLIALIKDYGVEYLFATVILAGLIQIMVGVFKWGKFVKLIPQPVMYGFLNGLAIVIFMAQVSQFKWNNNGVEEWMSGVPLYTMLGLTVLTVVVVLVAQRFIKSIPSSLIAILVVFGIVLLFNIDTKQVVDIASVSGTFPPFHIPVLPFNLETLQIIFPYALVMAGVGLIESLLTLNMVDEITDSKGNPNKEAIAQGTANITNGFFGGMGGCTMVAQTLVNLNAGAKTRLSAIIGALTILLIILMGSPVIEKIPLAALVGVMMIVAIKTFQWVSVRIINKMPKSDIIVGVLVAAITILLKNLALAVLVGVVISALVFAWDNAKQIRVKSKLIDEQTMVYYINGPLFFGSTTAFYDAFQIKNDPKFIILDFSNSKIVDMSAIDILKKLSGRYGSYEKHIVLKYLDTESLEILEKAKNYVQFKIEN
jgi:SulP family sulfate permease